MKHRDWNLYSYTSFSYQAVLKPNISLGGGGTEVTKLKPYTCKLQHTISVPGYLGLRPITFSSNQTIAILYRKKNKET